MSSNGQALGLEGSSFTQGMDVYISVTSLTLYKSYQIPRNKIQKPENRRPWAEIGHNTTQIHRRIC